MEKLVSAGRIDMPDSSVKQGEVQEINRKNVKNRRRVNIDLCKSCILFRDLNFFKVQRDLRIYE